MAQCKHDAELYTEVKYSDVFGHLPCGSVYDIVIETTIAKVAQEAKERKKSDLRQRALLFRP